MEYLSGGEKYAQSSTENCCHIPIVGAIAAGFPLLATENIEGFECVQPNPRVDFCLRVKGDSMIGARILNGDLVFYSPTTRCRKRRDRRRPD